MARRTLTDCGANVVQSLQAADLVLLGSAGAPTVVELARRKRLKVIPWADQPSAIALDPPGEQGVDRLKLRFLIDGRGQLTAEITDLATGANLGERIFGPVR